MVTIYQQSKFSQFSDDQDKIDSSSIDKACEGLVKRYPKLSIKAGMSKYQKIAFILVLMSVTVLLMHLENPIGVVFAFFSLLILSVLCLRAFAILTRLHAKENQSLLLIEYDNLPTFTLLLPLYKEARVAQQSLSAMERLNYPPHLLDVIYLVEEDDPDTRNALLNAKAELDFRIVTVPHCLPKTKPKALNYGLQLARGDIISVYDAEDIPHPDQLLAAAKAFIASDEKLAVIQAPLRAYNGSQSWFSSHFAIEYAIHFDVWLPFLQSAGWPIPLGGTSNHFKRDALEDVGAWDPYNVTEDADLGYRLEKLGYTSKLISLPTYEEAPETLSQWLPQRTRWFKGHMQTLIVLSRQPLCMLNRLGSWKTIGVVFSFAITQIIAAMNIPLMLAIIISMLCGQSVISESLVFLLVASIVIAALSTRVSSYKVIHWKHVASFPFYWILMSVASLRALYELRTQPFKWAKTPHGVSLSKDSPHTTPIRTI